MSNGKISALKRAILELFKDEPVWCRSKQKRASMRNHRAKAIALLDDIIELKDRRFHVWDEVDDVRVRHRLTEAIFHAQRGGIDEAVLRAVITLLE